MLPAFSNIAALFTSLFVTTPPRETISAARSSRNLFCATVLGRAPVKADEDEAYQFDRGILGNGDDDDDGDDDGDGDGDGDGEGDASAKKNAARRN